jgi:hypothetical protein
MRFPRVRFTVWRLMVAVAVFATATWGGQLAARGYSYRKMSDYHAASKARIESEWSLEFQWKRALGHFPACRTLEVQAEDAWKQAEWHVQMKVKYERAAARPWLPVEPDPPEPK